MFDWFADDFFSLVINRSGIFVRWMYHAIVSVFAGKRVIAYKKLYIKYTTDSDPSNRLSDSLINKVLGVGLIFILIFTIVGLSD